MHERRGRSVFVCSLSAPSLAAAPSASRRAGALPPVESAHGWSAEAERARNPWRAECVKLVPAKAEVTSGEAGGRRVGALFVSLDACQSATVSTSRKSTTSDAHREVTKSTWSG